MEVVHDLQATLEGRKSWLASVEVELPRLSDRREDLPLLERFFSSNSSQSSTANLRVANSKLAQQFHVYGLIRFEFIEKEAGATSVEEPGLRAFLKDRFLSADATPEEIEFLKQLRFEDGRSPTALYF